MGRIHWMTERCICILHSVEFLLQLFHGSFSRFIIAESDVRPGNLAQQKPFARIDCERTYVTLISLHFTNQNEANEII